jgi:hypothetical protein
MRRAATAAILALSALTPVVGGCGTIATETGYEPRRLGLGDAQRKGLYAPKYSPEQAQAQAERDADARRRAPGGNGVLGP